MSPEAITAKLHAAFPDADVELEDLTGTKDHWKARVVTVAFEGKTLIQRHRMVMAVFTEEMKGPIHALTLDVKAPSEAP